MRTATHFLRRRLPRTAPGAPRAVRLLALLLAVVVGACGDSTGPSVQVEGTYALRSLAGRTVPFSEGGVTVQSGTLSLDGTDWEMVIRSSEGDDVDGGTYVRSGSTIQFDSDVYFDSFDGTLSNGNRTLRLRYDASGFGDFVTIEFRR